MTEAAEVDQYEYEEPLHHMWAEHIELKLGDKVEAFCIQEYRTHGVKVLTELTEAYKEQEKYKDALVSHVCQNEIDSEIDQVLKKPDLLKGILESLLYTSLCKRIESTYMDIREGEEVCGFTISDPEAW